jgi:hypothetical protein
MRLSVDMSISREEFLRMLPAAVGPHVLQQDGEISGNAGQRHWTIRLVPLADHRLGSVVLPRHRIELSFEGYAEVEIAAFMARFHRGFQRGGG